MNINNKAAFSILGNSSESNSVKPCVDQTNSNVKNNLEKKILNIILGVSQPKISESLRAHEVAQVIYYPSGNVYRFKNENYVTKSENEIDLQEKKWEIKVEEFYTIAYVKSEEYGFPTINKINVIINPNFLNSIPLSASELKKKITHYRMPGQLTSPKNTEFVDKTPPLEYMYKLFILLTADIVDLFIPDTTEHD